MAERIGVADLFVFIVYMAHIYQPFLTLASINDVLQKASVSTDRVFQLLAIESDIVDAPDAQVPTAPRYSIQFDSVTFGYDVDKPVLDPLRHIEAETKAAFDGVGLIGPAARVIHP